MIDQQAMDDAAVPVLAAALGILGEGGIPRPALFPMRDGKIRAAVVAKGGTDYDESVRWLALMGTLAVSLRADALLLCSHAHVKVVPEGETIDVIPSEDPTASPAIVLYYVERVGTAPSGLAATELRVAWIPYSLDDRGRATPGDAEWEDEADGALVEMMQAILATEPRELGPADDPAACALVLETEGYETTIYERR